MYELYEIFAHAHPGDRITIPPKEYTVECEIPLVSHLHVNAEGAVFRFPKEMKDAHRRLFVGHDIHALSWQGGHFVGYVYDPARKENPWDASAHSVGICIEGGDDLTFENISAENLAGPILRIEGSEQAPVQNLRVSNLRAINCGKFMWDYGYLWQRITYPEYHSDIEVSNAYLHMPTAYYSDLLAFNGEKITSSRMPQKCKYDDAVTFFGEELPEGIVKGRYYYAQEADDGSLTVRERLSDPPILFAPSKHTRCKLFRGIYTVFHAMYAPSGGGGTKGAIDLRNIHGFSVSDCIFSSSGDATHFDACKDGEILRNRIEGGRMGAMFLAFGCENVLVTKNTVDGRNGSRVLTVESGGRHIRIIDNVFRGGGRGTWIDTPNGLLLKDNLFDFNTRKSTPDPAVGRLSPTKGDFERFAEIYFTTRNEEATYGNIVIEGNRIKTGEGCTASLAFNAMGRSIRIENNTFEGAVRSIYVADTCESPILSGNVGAPTVTDEIENEAFDMPGKIYLPGGMRS